VSKSTNELTLSNPQQKQTLNEVENLYFHHSHRRPASSATGTISRTAPVYPSLNFPASHQSKTPVSYKPKSRTSTGQDSTEDIASPSLAEGMQVASHIDSPKPVDSAPPTGMSPLSTLSTDHAQIDDNADQSRKTTPTPSFSKVLPTSQLASPPSELIPSVPTSLTYPPNHTHAVTSAKPSTISSTHNFKKRSHSAIYNDISSPHSPTTMTSSQYQPPSSSSVPPESTSTFRVTPKRPRHGPPPSSIRTPAAGVGTSLGIVEGRGTLTYDSFWSSHGSASTPTPASASSSSFGP